MVRQNIDVKRMVMRLSFYQSVATIKQWRQPHSAKKFYGTIYFFWITFIYFAESMTPDESLPTKQTVFCFFFLNFICDFNATCFINLFRP